MFLHALFMQEPKTLQTRRPWYQRVMSVVVLWKPAAKAPLATATGVPAAGSPNKPRLKKCTSVKVAASFRVCLCAPISSYNEPFLVEAGPRRSYGYPKTKPLATAKPERVMNTRASMDGRRLFRGKSLMDDILMRRFVLEEEAMMQLKRRNQMEFIRKRNALRRKKLGPSPLSRMTMAEEE